MTMLLAPTIKKIPNSFFVITGYILIVIISLVFTAKSIISNPYSPDSYLHLGIGKSVVEKHLVPQHSDISYKQDIEPSLTWISHSWLADSIFYLTTFPNQTHGPLLLLIPLLIVGIILTIYILSEISIHNHLINYFVISIGSILSASYWKVSPIIFLPILTLTLIIIYLKWKQGNYKYLFFLPFLSLIWANLAGGYIVIYVLFIFFVFIWEIINKFIFKIASLTNNWTGTLKIFSILSTISFFSSLINPSGARIHIYGLTLFSLIADKRYSSLSGALDLANNSIFKINYSSFYYIFFLIFTLITILVFLGLLTRLFSKRFSSFSALIPLFSFVPYAFIFIRFIPFVSFIVLVILSYLISTIWKEYLLTYLSLFSKKIRLVTFVSIILITLINILVIYLAINPPKTIKIDIPINQCNFILEHDLPSNIMAGPELVGYLYNCLYPTKGGIDASSDLFEENEAINIYTQPASPNTEAIDKLISDNSIKTIVVSKETNDMVNYLLKNKQWSLVYFDANGLILVDNTFMDSDFLQKYALKYVDFSRNLGFDPNNITLAQKEMEIFIERYPESILAKGHLASIYRFGKKFDLAEKLLTSIPEDKRNYQILTELGRLMAARGLCKSAENYYLLALDDRDEKNISRTVFDLSLLYAGCFNDPQKAKHYYSRYISYPIPESERQRAAEIIKNFIKDINTQ